MIFDDHERNSIEQVIRQSLRNKFKKYKPESSHMPFHYHLLGKDRMALFSFIQSLNTTFGTSIFEPVAVTLAKTRFQDAQSQYIAGDQISVAAQRVIQTIINELSVGKDAHKKNEIELIRSVSQEGEMTYLKTVKVDLFVQDINGFTTIFDIKTAKPNQSNFKDFKRTLLEWCAIMFAKDSDIQLQSIIAIPYNPYYPEPYKRWTMKGMLDLREELQVAEEFWDFLGGEGAYEELLGCFERVGIEMISEIDAYFKQFR